MSKLTISDIAQGIADAFSVRIGEQIRTEPGIDLSLSHFAVMLAPVPALPDPAINWATPMCVIGAQFSEGTWHWMQMAPNTKELIGLHLERIGAAPGQWQSLLVETSGGAA